MRRYYICFFLLAVFLTASALTGAYVWLFQPRQAEPVPGQILESEAVAEDNAVLNPDPMVRNEQDAYCLVAEDGFLLVFSREQKDVCLDTHMPVSEFPQEEQERLTDGLWFPSMIEVFNYLESYTS